MKCPIGTYNALANKYLVSHCLPCDAGYYGETTGLIVSTCTGKCSAGHYCNQHNSIGSTTHSPEDASSWGGRCRAGTYCPIESTQETVCAAGTYQPAAGQEACIACPIGYFCIEGVGDTALNHASHTPQLCAVGHKCESTGIGLTNGDACALGTYQPETGRDICL